jgi:hypothetical protein
MESRATVELATKVNLTVPSQQRFADISDGDVQFRECWLPTYPQPVSHHETSVTSRLDIRLKNRRINKATLVLKWHAACWQDTFGCHEGGGSGDDPRGQVMA